MASSALVAIPIPSLGLMAAPSIGAPGITALAVVAVVLLEVFSGLGTARPGLLPQCAWAALPTLIPMILPL